MSRFKDQCPATIVYLRYGASFARNARDEKEGEKEVEGGARLFVGEITS